MKKITNPFVRFAITTLICTAILLVSGPLAINMQGYTPVTLQSLAIIAVPVMFGMRQGAIAIVLYLLAGGLGLPVFADFSGGWDHFNGMTSGFLIGFLPAGILAGWWATRLKPQYGRFFLLFLTCQVVILLFGLMGFVFHDMGTDQILYNVKYLFPGLFIKSFIGGFLALAARASDSSGIA
jgi:biotin transport system substrate-specific component